MTAEIENWYEVKDGYRKIPEQLEVLADDEIISAISSICDELDLALANNAWHKLAFGAIVLAQLDKDNRKLGVK